MLDMLGQSMESFIRYMKEIWGHKANFCQKCQFFGEIRQKWLRPALKIGLHLHEFCVAMRYDESKLYVPLFVSYSEECRNLIKCLVLRFGHLAICKHPKKGQEDAKGEKGVIFKCRLHGGKPNANKKVSAPIDQYSNTHSGWSRPLWKEFCGDHPRYGARTNSKEDNVKEGWDNWQPPNPCHKLLCR